MVNSRCTPRNASPSGRVLMMEPEATDIDVARRNFALNGNPSNITIVPAGLWHERGTVRFAAGHGVTSSMVGDVASRDVANMIEVPTLAFRDLAADYDVKRIDFVKMDIEGAELEALAGLRRLSADLLPKRLAIASYHARDRDNTARRCEEILRDLGYRACTGHERHLTTWARR